MFFGGTTAAPPDMLGFVTEEALGEGVTARHYAVKRIAFWHDNDAARAAHEISVLSALGKQTNIASLVGSVWAPSYCGIAMELMHTTLQGFIHRHAPEISAEAALRLSIDLFRGIAHAHALHVVHCDVKPANLLLDASGKLKVGDVGSSRFVRGGAARLAGGAVIVSLPYRPPELLLGSNAVTK